MISPGLHRRFGCATPLLDRLALELHAEPCLPSFSSNHSNFSRNSTTAAEGTPNLIGGAKLFVGNVVKPVAEGTPDLVGAP